MADNINKMKIISLNSQGLKNNLTYVQKLIDSHDVTFISEHWLSNAELSLVKDILPANHKLHFSSAEKTNKGSAVWW